MPADRRELKVEAVTDTLASELAPAAPADRRGHRGRPPAAARRGRRAAEPHRRLPVATTRRCRRCCRPRSPKPPTPQPELAEPLQIVAGGAGHAPNRPCACSSCAARPPPSRWRTACSTATRGWCRSTRSAASPSGSASSAAEFHRPRRRSRAAVAARDDHAVHPRHQARRGRPRPHRRAVPGAVAVGRARRRLGSCDARRPTPATGLFLWQNVFGVWPVDGAVTDELRDRLHAYAEKAIREAALHTTWNDPDAEFESAVHAWLDDGHRRAGGRRVDRAGGPARPARPQRCPRPEAAAAHRARRARTSTRAPNCGRTASSTPTTAGRSTTRCAATALARAGAPQDSGRRRRAAAAPRATRHLPVRRLPAGAGRPGRRASTSSPSCAGDDVLVAVSRWTVRLAETGWGDTALHAARRRPGPIG